MGGGRPVYVRVQSLSGHDHIFFCPQGAATPRHLTHISGDVKFTTASFFLSEGRKIFQRDKCSFFYDL